MIAILLAAQLSAEVMRGPTDLAAATPPVGESAEFFERRQLRSAKACSAASRLETSAATPALLYREQDRARTRFSKLKDLPPAVGCLVGSQTVEAAK
jgi:hypothetical protein